MEVCLDLERVYAILSYKYDVRCLDTDILGLYNPLEIFVDDDPETASDFYAEAPIFIQDFIGKSYAIVACLLRVVAFYPFDGVDDVCRKFLSYVWE